MNLTLPMDLLTNPSNYHPHHAILNHHPHHLSSTPAHLPPTTPRLYNSPPPISNADPSVNECKLIEYRGKQLVSFTVNGEKMLCLPQAVDLFLKNYVGGPHTVYCKLKRLDIVPLVCNTEQIRILRGLGVLQPGVNRCKLLSCKEFDVLLDDCENARHGNIKMPNLNYNRTDDANRKRGRPTIAWRRSVTDINAEDPVWKDSDSTRLGRPPKRTSLSEYLLSQGHSQIKKNRLDQDRDYNYETDSPVTDSSTILDKTSSTILENSYDFNRHSSQISFMNNLHQGLSRISSTNGQNFNKPDHHQRDMEAILRSGLVWGAASATTNNDNNNNNSNNNNSNSNNNYQTQYEEMVRHLERLKDDQISNRSSSLRKMLDDPLIKDSNESVEEPILNLSKSNKSAEDDIDGSEVDSNKSSSKKDSKITCVKTEELIDTSKKLDISHTDLESTRPSSSVSPTLSQRNSATPIFSDERGFSMEILLRNIQALLKIATDNALQHEKQTIYERDELKMDVLREKEVKDSIEKQLIEERKLRVMYQKRYRKERKLRTRLG